MSNKKICHQQQHLRCENDINFVVNIKVTMSEKHFGRYLLCSIYLLFFCLQIVKSKVTWISPAACDQVTLRVTATGYICVKMTATQQIVILLLCVSFSFKCHKSGQVMCEFNTKVQSSNSLRLTIVSAKSKSHSPRRGYLSQR